MIRRPPRSTLDRSSAASDVYKRQDERLGEELVELVGIVVDPRDQVARAVLVEERDRQRLQFREQRVAEVEEDAAADAAHRLSLIHISEPTRPY